MPDVVWVRPASAEEIAEPPKNYLPSKWLETESPWNPKGDVVELAMDSARVRDKARETQQAPPDGEIGSAWNRYRIYAYYENGNIFENGPIETTDLEDMLSRDGYTRSIEQVLTLPLRSIDWSIKPAKNDAGECDFVTDALTRPPEMGGMAIPLQTVIGQMTSARIFKRAHFEKVFRHDPDGKVRFEKIAYRPPTTCYLARAATDASFQGFMQWTWKGVQFIKVIIPKERAFVYIHGEHRNPLEGITDLDVTWNAYMSKQKLRFLWYQFIETQASPRTAAKHSTQDEGQTEALAKKVAQLRGGGVVGLTLGQELAVLESNGTGAAQFAAAMGYLDQEMLASILGGFLGLTQQATGLAMGSSSAAKGSFALSQDQSQFFLNAGQAVLNEMSSAFTTGVIADLVRYNFGVDAACPRLSFGSLAEADAENMAFSLLQALAQAATPTSLLPYAFIDQLVVKAAEYLDMDKDVVQAAITKSAHDPSGTPADELEEQGKIPPGSAAVHNAIDATASLVGAASANGAAH